MKKLILRAAVVFGLVTSIPSTVAATDLPEPSGREVSVSFPLTFQGQELATAYEACLLRGFRREWLDYKWVPSLVVIDNRPRSLGTVGITFRFERIPPPIAEEAFAFGQGCYKALQTYKAKE